MLVDKLTSNGPAYAALLQEAVVSRIAFDGLLIGQARLTISKQTVSQREMRRIAFPFPETGADQRPALVTSHVCKYNDALVQT